MTDVITAHAPGIVNITLDAALLAQMGQHKPHGHLKMAQQHKQNGHTIAWLHVALIALRFDTRYGHTRDENNPQEQSGVRNSGVSNRDLIDVVLKFHSHEIHMPKIT
ncbi:hypothetical protein M8J76_004494 [Diaphorina citri]|nr:hypothetical protein M8J76_004494 [Diaphorina citri]